MKLVQKVFLTILFSSLLLIGTLYLFGSTFSVEAFKEIIGKEQLKLVYQTLDKIDRSLYQRYLEVQSLAETEEFEQFLGETTEQKPSAQDIVDILNEAAILTGPWDSLVLTDAQGNIFSTTNVQQVDGKITDSPDDLIAFRQALEGKTFYSDVVILERTKKPTIIFATPIRVEKAGRPIVGTVIAHLSWRGIEELLTNSEDSHLFDRNGRLIAAQNEKLPRFTQNFLNTPQVQQALRQREGYLVAQNFVMDNEVLLSHAKEQGYLDYKGHGWILLLDTPVQQALAPLSALAQTMGIVSLLIIIISGAFIFLLLVRLLKPIQEMTASTKEIAAGNLAKRVIVRSRDEIGELGVAFNTMADKLQALYAGLEEKVKEKTAQLARTVEELEKEKITLDNQKKILDSVINNMPFGVALLEPNGKPIIVNQAGIRLLGRGIAPHATNETAVEIYRLTKPDDTPYPVDELPTTLAARQNRIVTKDDIVVHKPNGEKITLRGTSVPIHNGKGEMTSIVSVFEDVTKERDIDRMKTEFISLASHQLRTPLSAIKWFVEMLLGGDAGELTTEQKEFAKNINDSTRRMIELVNSLLNISRIESGRILVDPKPTDLKELVEGIVKELQVKLTERQQSLVISVHHDLPKIPVDPKLIRQVYLNLLTNAIKYTQKGGEISVFISRKDNEIISQVTDNGYGIPLAEQPKIFKKFYRATNVVKIETDGTGLGLYLIKAIVESSQGRIWLSSEEGKGTTFWFSLPMSGMQARKGEVTLD